MSYIIRTLVMFLSVLALHCQAVELNGRVQSADGSPLEGAMITLRRAGTPGQGNMIETTVFSDDHGRFIFAAADTDQPLILRARLLGWDDVQLSWTAVETPTLVMQAQTDPAKLAAQLPANWWFSLVYEKVADPILQENLVRTCLYCHQQGSQMTRIVRGEAGWNQVLDRMAAYGGALKPELRAILPKLLDEAYAPSNAVSRLNEQINQADFQKLASADARRSVIDEWEVGDGESMQHDVMVHPSGRIHSVDTLQDYLYSIDPQAPDGDYKKYRIPHPPGFEIGGLLAGMDAPTVPGFKAYVAPHSLQTDSKGFIWITLSYGGRITRFDPKTGQWQEHVLIEGAFYPHTLRIDRQDRIWYTLMVSNHVGMLDTNTGEQKIFAIPPVTNSNDAPTPYGIDINPIDDSVWFSQLDADRIGRLDPKTGKIFMLDTPFPAPRGLRFDSKGKLWIPSFSGGSIVKYDPETKAYETFKLPTKPAGSDAVYSVSVNKANDDIWLSAVNSDTLIRLRPTAATDQRFTVFPLPTRVTFTREIEFDKVGRVITSNSNLPTRQIEGRAARIIRLQPGG